MKQAHKAHKARLVKQGLKDQKGIKVTLALQGLLVQPVREAKKARRVTRAKKARRVTRANKDQLV